MLKVSKPNSSVDFDVPGILIKEYPYQYAQPASIIFNKIIQSATWPRQWVKETVITISKLKVGQPKNEDGILVSQRALGVLCLCAVSHMVLLSGPPIYMTPRILTGYMDSPAGLVVSQVREFMFVFQEYLRSVHNVYF